MTLGLSAYLANAWLNMLRGTTFTAPTTMYVKLHVGDPGAAGTANASAVTTRVAMTLAAASGGSVTLTGTPPSWSMTATETLSHISLWDASSAGNFLWSMALSATKAVASGDTYTLTNDTLTFTPIAA